MIFRAIPILAAFLLAAPAVAAPAKTVKAPREKPITVQSLLAQAQAATARGDIDLAVRMAQSAIVADPARPASYVALGDIYADAGQPDYARSFYDQALGIDPADAGALKAIAQLERNPSATARNTK